MKCFPRQIKLVICRSLDLWKNKFLSRFHLLLRYWQTKTWFKIFFCFLIHENYEKINDVTIIKKHASKFLKIFKIQIQILKNKKK